MYTLNITNHYNVKSRLDKSNRKVQQPLSSVTREHFELRSLLQTGHGFSCYIFKVGGCLDFQSRGGQDLPSFLHLTPCGEDPEQVSRSQSQTSKAEQMLTFQTTDNRNRQVEIFGSTDHAISDGATVNNASEHIHQDGLDLRIEGKMIIVQCSFKG